MVLLILETVGVVMIITFSRFFGEPFDPRVQDEKKQKQWEQTCGILHFCGFVIVALVVFARWVGWVFGPTP